MVQGKGLHEIIDKDDGVPQYLDFGLLQTEIANLTDMELASPYAETFSRNVLLPLPSLPLLSFFLPSPVHVTTRLLACPRTRRQSKLNVRLFVLRRGSPAGLVPGVCLSLGRSHPHFFHQ